MPNKHAVKGKQYERDLVNYLRDQSISDFYVERTWGSNGRSSGKPEEVDLIIQLDKLEVTAQAKNYKWGNLPVGFRSFICAILTNVNLGIVKRQNSSIEESIVVLKLKDLVRMLKKWS